MKIKFLGVGAAIDDKYENVSILVEEKSSILLDVGYGIVRTITKDKLLLKNLDAIYISHLHFDHCFGLPALLLFMRTVNRKKPIKIIAQKEVLDGLKDTLKKHWPDMQTAIKFPVNFLQISAQTQKIKFNEFEIKIAKTNHGQMPNFAISLKSNGKTIVYSGDGDFNNETIKLYKGCDLLIHDAFTIETKNDTHSSIVELIRLYKELKLKAMAFVHMDSEERNQMSKIQRLIKEAKINAFVPEPETRLII